MARCLLFGERRAYSRKSTKMKFIGIIGSRRRNALHDFRTVKAAFDRIYQDGDWIVSGGCPKGGDAFAEEIAKERGIPIIIFYPNWGKFGKAAGFVRNGDIAKHSDCIIACCSSDRKGGTEDTIAKYKKKAGTEDEDDLALDQRLLIV